MTTEQWRKVRILFEEALELALSARAEFLATKFDGDDRPNIARLLDGGVTEDGCQYVVKEPIIGHARRVLSLAFSHDGRLLICGGKDKTVRVWRAASAEDVRARGGK